MIRFACPTCKSVLQSPGHTASSKVACPKCGQRLLVPNPVKPAASNKTVLGSLVPDSAGFSTRPAPGWKDDHRTGVEIVEENRTSGTWQRCPACARRMNPVTFTESSGSGGSFGIGFGAHAFLFFFLTFGISRLIGWMFSWQRTYLGCPHCRTALNNDRTVYNYQTPAGRSIQIGCLVCWMLCFFLCCVGLGSRNSDRQRIEQQPGGIPGMSGIPGMKELEELQQILKDVDNPEEFLKDKPKNAGNNPPANPPPGTAPPPKASNPPPGGGGWPRPGGGPRQGGGPGGQKPGGGPGYWRTRP